MLNEEKKILNGGLYPKEETKTAQSLRNFENSSLMPKLSVSVTAYLQRIKLEEAERSSCIAA